MVQPDLVFLSNGRRQRITSKNIQGAPDLVVEVISDASRRLDKKLKRALYSRYDVLEYWLFDPELRIAEIYRRDAGNRLAKVAEYEDDGQFTSPILPDLNLDIATLWPEEEA